MKSCLSLFNSMSPFSRKKVYGGEMQQKGMSSNFSLAFALPPTLEPRVGDFWKVEYKAALTKTGHGR